MARRRSGDPLRQGSDAAWRDEPVSACPHRAGTREHLEWVRGWSEIMAAGASGVSVEEKAALGLAPVPTRVGWREVA